MKVLHIITKSEPMGGAQKYVYDITRALNERDVEVTVALGGTGTLTQLLEKEGIRTIPITSFQRNINIFKEIRAFFELIRIYKEEEPNIVHLSSSKAGGTGAFAAWVLNIIQKRKGKRRIRTIFTAHGWAFTEDRPLWQRIVIYYLHLLTILFADITIAVSDYTREEVLKHAPSFLKQKLEKKVISIPNGIEPFNLIDKRTARKELIEKTPLRGSIDLWNTQTLWIGSIGELHQNKGIDIAIEAMARIASEFSKHNVSLVYFVIGDGEKREELEQLIRRRRLNPVIYLVGFIPDAQKYLSAFDLFLLPSRKEGLPWTLLEAGYAGLPVIASTGAGGAKDVIANEKNGILVPPDPQKLGDAILSLAKNTPKRIDLGKALKKDVENGFQSEEMVQRTIRLYWMLE
ncbi:MAG: glycosyltransferase [Candidatus Paceibacterota bacterium]